MNAKATEKKCQNAISKSFILFFNAEGGAAVLSGDLPIRFPFRAGSKQRRRRGRRARNVLLDAPPRSSRWVHRCRKVPQRLSQRLDKRWFIKTYKDVLRVYNGLYIIFIRDVLIIRFESTV